MKKLLAHTVCFLDGNKTLSVALLTGALLLVGLANPPVAVAHGESGWGERRLEYHQKNIAPYSLLHAATHGDVAEVKRLIGENTNPNEANKDGITALMVAAFFGHAEVVKVLLEAGANPNMEVRDGWTALMNAASEGHAEVVKVLLEAGANPNAVDKAFKALIAAQKFKGRRAEVVKVL